MNNNESEIPVKATESSTYSTPDKSTVTDITWIAIKVPVKIKEKEFNIPLPLFFLPSA